MNLTFSSEIHKKIESWLQPPYDQATQKALQQLLDEGNEAELKDAFYKDLEFGTGGLRGIMGIGTNRINQYTVAMVTQGFANFLLGSRFAERPLKVVVAYDSRNNSQALAQITANVFSANDIKVYFFENLRPTPELSFAIRHLKCHAGVIITASHNPKEYNGYKAYGYDGAQLVSPEDKNVIEEIKKIKFEEVKFEAKKENIEILGEEIDQLYLAKIQEQVIHKQAILAHKDLKIVYTPLHGTGIILVPKVLNNLGFEQIHVVEAQAEPNGDFPTVIYPNPEEKEALTLALQKAKAIDADLVLATDPDADRVGVAVKNHKNEFQLLNGNQTGTLILHFLIKSWQEAGKLKGKEYIVKTIVTTNLIDKIAEQNQVNCYNTLTGFKYIASVIRNLEGKQTFIGGCEESYGYMIGDFVRDKDGIAACAIMAEILAYAKSQGKTVFDLLLDIYQTYGYYYEELISITKKGIQGVEAIQQMMQRFRENPPKTLAGSKIIAIKDFQQLKELNLLTKEEQPLAFEKSNVLQFFTEDGSKISARPSGTEPKIKFYISVNAILPAKDQFDVITEQLQKKAALILKDLAIDS